MKSYFQNIQQQTSSNFWQIISNAFDRVSIVPTIVTIRSGVVPSLIFIRAPLYREIQFFFNFKCKTKSKFTSSRIDLILSPRLPMILPTSFNETRKNVIFQLISFAFFKILLCLALINESWENFPFHLVISC